MFYWMCFEFLSFHYLFTKFPFGENGYYLLFLLYLILSFATCKAFNATSSSATSHTNLSVSQETSKSASLILKNSASFITCSRLALRCPHSILLKIAWSMSSYSKTMLRGIPFFFPKFTCCFALAFRILRIRLTRVLRFFTTQDFNDFALTSVLKNIKFFWIVIAKIFKDFNNISKRYLI